MESGGTFWNAAESVEMCGNVLQCDGMTKSVGKWWNVSECCRTGLIVPERGGKWFEIFAVYWTVAECFRIHPEMEGWGKCCGMF